jgi:hypothetical protein
MFRFADRTVERFHREKSNQAALEKRSRRKSGLVIDCLTKAHSLAKLAKDELGHHHGEGGAVGLNEKGRQRRRPLLAQVSLMSLAQSVLLNQFRSIEAR